MTLTDLIKDAKSVGDMFSAYGIPLKYKGRDVEITFTPEGSNDTGWVINLQVEQK